MEALKDRKKVVKKTHQLFNIRSKLERENFKQLQVYLDSMYFA